MSDRKLVRSRNHRVIAGVCGGLADYFEIDPNLVRLGFAAATFFSAGLTIGAYLLAWLAIADQGSGETGADQLYDRYGDYKRRRAARDHSAADDSDEPKDTFSADQG